MKRLPQVSKARRGATLVEVVLSAGLIAGVLGLAGFVAGTGAGAFESTADATVREGASRRVMDRLVAELTGLNSTMMFPDPGADGVDAFTYQLPVAFENGAAVAGPLMELRFEQAGVERDDGVDNDGDGLVDEYSVVLVRDPDEATELQTVLTYDASPLLEGETLNGEDDNGNGLVDESGFWVQRVDGLLVIRLSTLSVDAEGHQLIDTTEVSIESKE